MGAAAKITQTAASILRDMIKNDGKSIATIVLSVVSLFIGIMLFFIIPIALYERTPLVTKEQATWYWQTARSVTGMTQSPVDPGVYVDWQNVIAIDTVLLKQNFKKSSESRAYSLALRFIEQVDTVIVGEGEDKKEYPIYRLKTVDEVMAELKMSEKEQKAVHEKYLTMRYDFLIGVKSEAFAGDYSALYSGDMNWPMPSNHSVSSPYGMRVHPAKKGENGEAVYTMHYGIDIPATEGTIIQAPTDGLVKSYSYSDAVGWTMVVDHGENEKGERITTRYCHLLDIIAAVGREVKSGDPIAKVGNTGYLTTGAHLHFEVYVNGVTVDPVNYFQAR